MSRVGWEDEQPGVPPLTEPTQKSAQWRAMRARQVILDAMQSKKEASLEVAERQEEVERLKKMVREMKDALDSELRDGDKREEEVLAAKTMRLVEAQQQVTRLMSSYTELQAQILEMQSINLSGVGVGSMLGTSVTGTTDIESTVPSSEAARGSLAVNAGRLVLLGFDLEDANAALMAVPEGEYALALEYLEAHGKDRSDKGSTRMRGGGGALRGSARFAAAGHVAVSHVRTSHSTVTRVLNMLLTMVKMARVLVKSGAFEWIGIEGLVIRAMQALVKLAEGKSAPSMLRLGAVEVALLVLTSYPDSSECQSVACRLIENLTLNLLTTELIARHPKLFPAALSVLYALRASSGAKEPDLIEAAAGTLWTLVMAFGTSFQTLLVGAGAPEDFLDIMKEFKGAQHAGLLRATTGALLALALENASTQEKLAAMGAPHEIQRVMVERPEIKFKGEFKELGPWVRGEVTVTGLDPRSGRHASDDLEEEHFNKAARLDRFLSDANAAVLSPGGGGGDGDGDAGLCPRDPAAIHPASPRLGAPADSLRPDLFERGQDEPPPELLLLPEGSLFPEMLDVLFPAPAAMC
mmetsp:Transcript_22696/g.73849  ORF Transcript_22696/g.73849 Transcript_22696/m.73849 type:complete len:581 (-) Transcript_22696:144-1886(-)